MKKTAVILLLSILAIKGFSQSSQNRQDSIIKQVSLNVGPPPVDNPPMSNDTQLRGKFQMVFKSQKYWKDFSIGYDKKYIWIDAPETNWYDRNLGPSKSNKNDLCEDLVMVDSTVTSYYNHRIKDFVYDDYNYEIEYQKDGTVREFYKFYRNGNKVRSYILAWNETELLSIYDYKFEGRQ